MPSTCPYCHANIGYVPELVGQRVRCPHCDNHFIMREECSAPPIRQAIPAAQNTVAPTRMMPIGVKKQGTATQRLVVALLAIIVALLAIILVLMVWKKDKAITIDDLAADERRAYAGLVMLAAANELPTEFEKRMWIMATTMIDDGYHNNGKPLDMTFVDIDAATMGYRTLSPPDNGLFPIEWKLVRKSDFGGETPPSWLSCFSAGDFSYELHDRIAREWMRALQLFPRSEWDAAHEMLILGSVLHEKQSTTPGEFESYARMQRTRVPNIQIDYSIREDPYIFDVVMSYESEWCRFECRVGDDFDGSRVIMRINCLKSPPPLIAE